MNEIALASAGSDELFRKTLAFCGYMAAYLLGNFKVTNAEGFEKYRDLVTKTIRDHGGEYVL